MQLLGIDLIYVIFAAGAVVVWILLREFNCWYWKINDRLFLLEEILSRLEKLEGQQQQEPPPLNPHRSRPEFPEIKID